MRHSQNSHPTQKIPPFLNICMRYSQNIYTPPTIGYWSTPVYIKWRSQNISIPSRIYSPFLQLYATFKNNLSFFTTICDTPIIYPSLPNISIYLDDILQGEWNINVISKLFEVQPIIKRSFTPMERRRGDVVLCRARIGHAYFTNGYLLRGELRPMCCNTRLTVRHVLLSCAKYAHIRRKYFAVNSLFELFRDTPAGFIIQFLRECNLYYMF